jgi:hypothetical protein
VKRVDDVNDAPAAATPAADRRHHHAWRYALVAVATLVLATAGYPTIRYAFRSHPRAKSMTSAVSEFRVPGDANQSSQWARASFLQPEAGVYRATGTGTEKISFPPNSQRDGAVIPVTVRHTANGCWRWRIDYNEAHWHEYDFCPRGAKLFLDSQRNFQSWDFGATKIGNLARYTCSPPAPIVDRSVTPGERFAHRCTGTNSAVAGTSITAGPVEIVSTEPLTVGGTKVTAIRQVRRQTITGAQRGTVEEEWWFAEDTGLPLRATRNYRVASSSPVGDITYTERGGWTLQSVHPTR